MFFIYILFIMASSSATPSLENTVMRTIENSVHSHAYLRNVHAMCEVVTHRLTINGIYVLNQTDCTHADINSTMATTLDGLYKNFDKIDLNILKTRFYLIQKRYTTCQRECVVEKLFNGPIKYWVHDNIPLVKWVQHGQMDNSFYNCWPNCNFNVTLGPLIMNEPAFEPCFVCLAAADKEVDQYNKFRVEFIQYEALLSREIALVWRFQMPDILRRKSSSAVIKY